MSGTLWLPPPRDGDDELASYLDGLSDRVLRGFVPAATTLKALKRLNGCMAILCAKNHVAVTDEGVAYSTGEPVGPTSVKDPEPA